MLGGMPAELLSLRRETKSSVTDIQHLRCLRVAHNYSPRDQIIPDFLKLEQVCRSVRYHFVHADILWQLLSAL